MLREDKTVMAENVIQGPLGPRGCGTKCVWSPGPTRASATPRPGAWGRKAGKSWWLETRSTRARSGLLIELREHGVDATKVTGGREHQFAGVPGLDGQGPQSVLVILMFWSTTSAVPFGFSPTTSTPRSRCTSSWSAPCSQQGQGSNSHFGFARSLRLPIDTNLATVGLP